ncbi:MAG: hypothetical protein ABR569_09710 [Gaiellaceae bacterium]
MPDTPWTFETLGEASRSQLGFPWLTVFYSYFVLGRRERIEQGQR